MWSVESGGVTVAPCDGVETVYAVSFTVGSALDVFVVEAVVVVCVAGEVTCVRGRMTNNVAT